MKRTQTWLLAALLIPACREPAAAPAITKAAKPAKQVVKPPPGNRPDAAAHAQALAKRFIILDGHIDVPHRLEESRGKDGELTEDVTRATEKGDFDYPRAVKGGLDAPFMSIYVPAKLQKEGGAKALADRLIDMVEGIAKSAPDRFAIARSVADVRRNFAEQRISLPLGMENGAPLEGKLSNLKHFFDRGIRYITLTHSKDNAICDSSYDDRHTHGGLSTFGKQVVAEMNRLGIMIDISHITDDAALQVLESSQAPVIASHSSCRHFTPDWERNMGDALIKKLAEKGGVIQINFGSGFLDPDVRNWSSTYWKAKTTYRDKNGLDNDDPKLKAWKKNYKQRNPPMFATVQTVADHIDHVVKLVGVDHVGLGSDFDGVGDSLPVGLKDASQYPNLLRVLIERGYSDGDIEKICSKNVLRVWSAVEQYAANATQPAK